MKTAAVCICTLNRNDSLRECLKSLCNQEESKGWQYSIVIVDNSANRKAFEVLEEFGDEDIVYLNEARKGIVYARNMALSYCRSSGVDIMLFTDDDCYAASNWVKTAITFLVDSEKDWVAGQIVKMDDYEFCPSEGVIRRIKNVNLAATGNLAIKMTALNEARFSECFNEMGGEDKHFTLTLSKLGHRGAYVDGLCVYHIERAERTSYDARVNKFKAGFCATFWAYWLSGWKAHGIAGLVAAIRFPILFLALRFVIFFVHSERFIKIANLKLSKYKGRSLGLASIFFGKNQKYFS